MLQSNLAYRLSHIAYRLINNRLMLLSAICHLLLAICVFAQGEFKYDSKGRRNPFIPWVTPDGKFLKIKQIEGMSGLALEGIIYDKTGLSYAIVNNEVVKMGDRSGDYQVLKIEEDRVIFIKEGEPVEIELMKEEP